MIGAASIRFPTIHFSCCLVTNYGSAEHVQKTTGVTFDGPDKSQSENHEINQQQPVQKAQPRGRNVAVSHPKSKSTATPLTRAPSNPRQQKGSVRRTIAKQAMSSQVEATPHKKQSVPARGDSKPAKPLQPLALHSRLTNSPYLGMPVRKASAPSCLPTSSKLQVKQPSKIASKQKTKLSI